MQRRSFLLLIAAGVGACTTQRQEATQLPAIAFDGPYLLDSGDRLRVTVFEQPTLTNSYAVDQAGYISFPLIGNVYARNRTTRQLAATIASSLDRGFLKKADVSVEIDAYRPFFIMGEVKNPGQYAYVAGLTVETAVAIAGGFTVRASEKGAKVSRAIGGQVTTGVLPLDAAVRPGDVLTIDRRLF